MGIFKVKKSTVIINLFVIIVFMQNPPWPFWDSWFYFLFFCFLISSYLLFDRIVKYKPINKDLFLFTCILLLFFVVFQSFQRFRTSSLVSIVIFYQLFFLTTEEKCSILDRITTLLAIIIAVSLPLWLINQYVFELPFGSEMHYGEWKGKNQTLILENFYFFVNARLEHIIRFYSVFDEPGTLGTLSAFLLFANKYNFRDKRILIILIGAFFTFSLAFFILTGVGLILFYIRTLKLILIFSMTITVIIVLTIITFKRNPTFEGAVLNRITSVKSSLEIRTSEETTIFFREYVTSSQSILGKGPAFFSNNPELMFGNGSKFFLIENGFLGLFLVIGMYLLISGKANYLVLSYLIIFLLSFLQRPFLFTPYQLIVFAAGVASLKSLPAYDPRN